MSYVLPTFNLAANIWRATAGIPNDYTAPEVVSLVNLSCGRRMAGAYAFDLFPWGLFPALTDVRQAYNFGNQDVVEIPAGSLRFYGVVAVQDMGKGFANEHRVAMLQYLQDGITFVVQGAIPAPVPFP